MSFESSYLSREGYSEIIKITEFFKTLIVKNATEASQYEDNDTLYNYSRYASAYANSKNPFDFMWTYDDLKLFFNDIQISTFSLTSADSINRLLSNSSHKATAERFLDYIQQKELRNYREMNEYYRTFMGLPPTDSDTINVENLDFSLDSGNRYEYIPLHEVTLEKYPLTFEYFFVKNHVSEVIVENPDLHYIKFINNKYSPYYLRECPDFTILYCDKTLLTQDEYNRFIKAYKRAQNYVNEVIFIVGMNDRYPLYSNLMYLNILFYTFQIYMNLRIKDYSLHKYTDLDIYDILDSNGLSKLKDLSDISLLRKVVTHLDILKEYKGSEKVLSLLFDLIADNSLTVKRFDLVKEYPTDLTNSLKFDLTKPYDKQVDLKFKENIIRSGDEYVIPSYVDYDMQVDKDDLWGGVKDTTDELVKSKIKDSLKKKILSMDFGKIGSKYISLSKTLNIYKSSFITANVLYLILEYCTREGQANGYNSLLEDKIKYDDLGNTVQPLVLFAAICYFNSWVSGISEPEKINPDKTILANVNILRGNKGIKDLVNDISNVEIDISADIYKVSIGDLMTGEEIENFLVKYPIDSGCTLLELVDEYGTNAQMMSDFGDLIHKMDDQHVYEAWTYIYNNNRIDYKFIEVFDGHDNYMEFIRAKNLVFAAKIEKIIDSIEDLENTEVLLNNLGPNITDWTQRLEKYLTNLVESKYIVGFGTSEKDAQYLSDLKKLLDEFLSIYMELYNMEYVTDVSDEPYNMLKIRFLPLDNIIQDDLSEQLRLKYIEFLNEICENIDENMILNYDTITTIFEGFQQEIHMLYESNYDILSEELNETFKFLLNKIDDIIINDYQDELYLTHLIEDMEEIIDNFFEEKLEFLQYLQLLDELSYNTSHHINIQHKPLSIIIEEEYNDTIGFIKYRYKELSNE